MLILAEESLSVFAGSHEQQKKWMMDVCERRIGARPVFQAQPVQPRIQQQAQRLFRQTCDLGPENLLRKRGQDESRLLIHPLALRSPLASAAKTPILLS